MRGKVSIIKKLFVVLLFTVSLLTLSAEPYKPYPILFIHGVNSGSGTWGAPVCDRETGDSIRADSIASTYQHSLGYMNPYVILWKAVDGSYTIPGEDAYPNKTFLEVINFDDKRDKTKKD